MSVNFKVATTYKVECNDSQKMWINPDTMVELANVMGLDNHRYLQCPNEDNLQTIAIDAKNMFKFIDDLKKASAKPEMDFLDYEQLDVVERCCEEASISLKTPMKSLAEYLENFFKVADISDGFIHLIYE